MGGEVCRAVEAAADMELVAGIDAGDDRSPLTAAEVVVDFTHPDAVLDNLRWCVEHGLHAVVGTSGFGPDKLAAVRGWLAEGDGGNVLIGPNFGIAAVLMMHF